ncbi:MAG: 4-aminobutyrate aminotransferase [uncultured bacterium]|nr:MAG: 4-aminobutyrate aminotransferase [uncultured bacterium]HBY73097.1 hypothetical protein [Candidatus Kerfeldbacteria bacterium]
MNTALADYSSRDITLATGKGCLLYDDQGKEYVDFLGGWCVSTVGWQHPEMAAAVQRAMTESVYIPSVCRSTDQQEFAEILVDHSPQPQQMRAYRCTSGSEAVEFAIKCARATTKKPTIVSIEGVYHGHTYGAASVGRACGKNMEPCLTGFIKLPMPNAYRHVTAEQVIAQFKQLLETRTDIAAFLSEPIWSNAGILIPPDDFYPQIEALCRTHSVLFVMDEVAVGCGRTGKWLASEWWNLKPDIICLGKGITGGYGTLGSTLVTEAVYQASRGIPAYSTFGWLMTDLAAARANVEIILRDKLWENADHVGTYLLEQLKPLEQLPCVGEVRGKGLLIGLEIVQDKTTQEPDTDLADKIKDACAATGLLLETADNNVLFLSPPLVLSQAEAKRGADIMLDVFAQLAK